MSQQQVKFEQFFAAKREKVFAWFSDHEKLSRLFGGKITRIKDSTDPVDVNGLGSVREIRVAGTSFEETIVKYESPALIEYAISKGSPVKNHHGRMEFHAVDGGTKLIYSIGFDPKIPLTGGLIAGVLCTTIHQGLPRAVREIAAA